MMLAGSSTTSYATYRSVASAMQVPLIDWEVSNRRLADEHSSMAFSVRPPIDDLLVDYMIYKGWHRFVYIHDGKNAMRTLFSVFSYAQKSRPDWLLEEMEDADLSGFHYSLINITGFQLFDRYSKEFIKERKSFEDHYREKMPSSDWLTHGHLLAEAIKKVVLDERNGTLTGRIEFDPETGLRKNFSATVIEIRPGVNSLTSIKERFQWAHGQGFLFGKTRTFYEQQPDRTPIRKGILADKPWKLRFNVVTLLVKPFVMLKRQNPGEPELTGNDRFEGYCVDLLRLLAQNISGFDWDGSIGYLLNETADIAVAPLTINQERERVVDFSKPFMTTGISIMISKPEKQEFSIFSFMQPLGMTIWIFTVCSYIGFSMYNSLWFTLAAFMQQGTDILPRALSGRIASACWWFYTLIIVSS
ncbi:unnamed protein product, partial [Mesorhabditis spiculigera]